jgi:hypothetical protein
VCGIDPEKKRRDLSATEKKIRRHARAIHAVAIAHLVSLVLAVLIMPEFAAAPLIVLVALTNGFLAYGLIRYSLIAYKVAIAIYFFIGMVGVISIQKGPIYLGWIAVALVALYLVGNGTAKAIFERTTDRL